MRVCTRARWISVALLCVIDARACAQPGIPSRLSLEDALRIDLEKICNLRVADPRGRQIPTSQLADIVGEQVKLPAGYYVEYGGQFENLERASARLLLVVPLALLVLPSLCRWFEQEREEPVVLDGTARAEVRP